MSTCSCGKPCRICAMASDCEKLDHLCTSHAEPSDREKRAAIPEAIRRTLS